MARQPTILPHVLVLAEALRPLAAQLATALAEPAPGAGRGVRLDAVQDHISRIDRAVEGVAASLNRLGAALAAAARALGEGRSPRSGAGGACPADARDSIHRAAGGFAVHVDALCEGYAEVARIPPGSVGKADEGRDLLAAVYRGTLAQIRDWLDEVLHVVDDPVDAMARQGVNAESPAGESVELSFTLTITPPPEVHQLAHWMERQAERAARPAGTGFWSRVAGVALGIGIADWLFLEDD